MSHTNERPAVLFVVGLIIGLYFGATLEAVTYNHVDHCQTQEGPHP